MVLRAVSYVLSINVGYYLPIEMNNSLQCFMTYSLLNYYDVGSVMLMVS